MAWLRDLVVGRSSGCRSKRCRNAWEVAGEIAELAPHLERRNVARWLREIERSPAAILRDVFYSAARPAAVVKDVLERNGLLREREDDG